jgi:GTP-binding protein
MLRIKTATFMTSAIQEKQYPNLKNAHHEAFSEIAFLGKSNVGKSSLINHLVGRKGLAKTSGVPGKTRLINFFMINEEFILVDLPGYGFAKATKKEKETWQDSIQHYLHNREALKGVVFLVDSRHPLGENDLILKQWILHQHLPCIVVFTKFDKIKNSLLVKQKKMLLSFFEDTDFPTLFYSVKEGDCKPDLINSIEELLER